MWLKQLHEKLVQKKQILDLYLAAPRSCTAQGDIPKSPSRGVISCRYQALVFTGTPYLCCFRIAGNKGTVIKKYCYRVHQILSSKMIHMRHEKGILSIFVVKSSLEAKI
jgi:hypothetical protein